MKIWYYSFYSVKKGPKYIDKGWWEYPVIEGAKSWFNGEKISYGINKNKIKRNRESEIRNLSPSIENYQTP